MKKFLLLFVLYVLTFSFITPGPAYALILQRRMINTNYNDYNADASSYLKITEPDQSNNEALLKSGREVHAEVRILILYIIPEKFLKNN